MRQPSIPPDEEKRLALLRACNIIYTPAEEAFDDVAQLAADLCGTEIDRFESMTALAQALRGAVA